MKKFLIYLSIVFTVIIIGCEDDSNPVGASQGSTFNGISGRITNWTFGSSMLIEFDVYGSSTIDEVGNFQINNLSVPIGNQFESIVDYYTGFDQQPTISDANANIYFIRYLDIVYSNNRDNVASVAQMCSSFESFVDYELEGYFTYYVYFDRTVTINGTSAWRNNGNNFKEVFNNVTFQKGWNKYVNKVYSIDRNTSTYTFEILRSEPGEGEWYYLEPTTSSSEKILSKN